MFAKIPSLTFILLAAALACAADIYVDTTAAGDATGTSWQHAFNHLQDALAIAQPGDNILVAQGVYTPDRNSASPGGTQNRDAAFELPAEVSIFGGFPAGGTEPHLRDPAAYPTILSGDLADDDQQDFGNYNENARHIILAIDIENALLDGFTIQGAFCDDVLTSQGVDTFGGAGALVLESELAITNCRFEDNLAQMTQQSYFAEAGALLALGSNVNIKGCDFQNNRAVTHWGQDTNSYGGAILIETSNVFILDSSFDDNSTFRFSPDSGPGGAIYSQNAHLELINCDFTWNNSGWEAYGGAVFALSTDLYADQCRFAMNDSWLSGGAIYALESQIDIRRTSFRDNRTSFSGGALAGVESQTHLDSCEFIENKAGAEWSGGAAVFIMDAETSIQRSIFVANSTTGGGFAYGGAALLADNPEQLTLSNCTLFGNYTYDQPQYVLSFLTDSPAAEISISNTIIWDENEQFTGDVIYADHPASLDVSYSNILGSWPGTGNIAVNPDFAVEPDVAIYNGYDPLIELLGRGDLHLLSTRGRWHPAIKAWVTDSSTSPCVDAGDPQTNPRREPWPHGGRANMGAYGTGAQASMSSNNIGNIADLNLDSVVDLQDYAMLARHWFDRNPYTIAHGSVSVDGQLDDWQNVRWVQLDRPYYQNADDILWARFALQWNRAAGKIYAAVVVEDTDHVFTDDFAQWDAGDRLEIYSQPTAAGGTDFWHWQNPAWHTAQQYSLGPSQSDSWASWGNGDQLDADTEFEHAVTVYDDFIVYEIGVRQFDYYGTRLDQPNVTSELYPGKTVGFDLVVASRDDQNFGMLSENLMLDKFQNAANFAKYVLLEDIDTMPCPQVLGDLDRNCALNYRDIATFAQQWLAE